MNSEPKPREGQGRENAIAGAGLVAFPQKPSLWGRAGRINRAGA